MTVIDSIDWVNGTTLWRVEYEYADSEGGGQRLDYFKTANRYRLPGSLEMVRCLNSDDMTVIGFERVEWYATDTPDEQPSLAVPHDLIIGAFSTSSATLLVLYMSSTRRRVRPHQSTIAGHWFGSK